MFVDDWGDPNHVLSTEFALIIGFLHSFAQRGQHLPLGKHLQIILEGSSAAL